MGRGNSCVYGDYEGLYYVYWDNFTDEYENEDGEVITDYTCQRREWEDSLSIFKTDLMNRFKSFYDCDFWINKEEHVILENSLFYIAIEEEDCKIAIKLLQKEQDYYSKGNIEGLQKGLYQKYLEGIKQCLFNQFDEVGIYGGAWTSGIIKKSA